MQRFSNAGLSMFWLWPGFLQPCGHQVFLGSSERRLSFCGLWGFSVLHGPFQNQFLLAGEIYLNRLLIQRQLRIRFPIRFWRMLGRRGKPCLRQHPASPQSLPGQPVVAESGNLGAIHGNAGPPDCFRAHGLLGQEISSRLHIFLSRLPIVYV